MVEQMEWLVLCLALAVFVWQAFRHAQFQWLWFSVALWLVLGGFSASLFPNILGITHGANAFLWHTYLFVGSIFFWINHIVRISDVPKKYWCSSNGAVFLTLLSLASLLIHLMFALWLALAMWIYPNGVGLWAVLYALEWYVANPIGMVAMHAWLMAIFYVYRRWQGQRADVFSVAQLQAGWLMMAIWLVYGFVNMILTMMNG